VDLGGLGMSVNGPDPHIRFYQRPHMVSEAHGSERFARRAEGFNDLQVTAALYSRFSPEGRRMAGGEEPGAVLKAMQGRVVGTMARFKVPQDDALAFSGIVKTRGMEAYGRVQFPDQFPAKKN
jgi:hypothetical protein